MEKDQQKTFDFFKNRYNEIIPDINHSTSAIYIPFPALIFLFASIVLIERISNFFWNPGAVIIPIIIIWAVLILILIVKRRYIYFDKSRIIDCRSANFFSNKYIRREIVFSDIDSAFIDKTFGSPEIRIQFKKKQSINLKIQEDDDGNYTPFYNDLLIILEEKGFIQ